MEIYGGRGEYFNSLSQIGASLSHVTLLPQRRQAAVGEPTRRYLKQSMNNDYTPHLLGTQVTIWKIMSRYHKLQDRLQHARPQKEGIPTPCAKESRISKDKLHSLPPIHFYS